MRKLSKKVSAIVLTALFATMQVAIADPINTGVGTINGANGGFNGVDPSSTNNNVNLNFTGDSHLNWDTLNVGGNQSLNFNAINGANGITVLNTVNRGMTTVAGQITANSGIANLIISNPNGVLMQGGRIETVGNAMVTTQPMTATFIDGKMDISNVNTTNAVGVVTIKDSSINVGGEFNILAPSINVVGGAIKAQNGVKLITQNGQDYLSTGNDASSKGVRLETVNIDGDVYVIADKGVVKTVGGGEIKGNLNIKSDDSVSLNYVDNGKVLHVTGDVDVEGNGVLMYARNTKVDGNLNMTNGGGFLEVGNVHVGKNMTLKTPKISENKEGYKHFVHVVGNNKVGGDVTIESENNIHIGNYNYEQQQMLDGSLTVGGNLTAHAKNGHVMTTVDVKANKISLKSDNLNVLTDGKATLTANEYEFSSAGYLGGLEGTNNIINVMENYVYIPNTVKTPANINIAGGTITKIETPSVANILSKGDVKVTGAQAGTINITAPNKYMEITGDVHAKEINVGKETDKLKVDFPGRDYKLNYTNIRDNKVVTVNPDDVITYEFTDGKGGNNDAEQIKGENTYLVGPEKPVEPPVDPVEPTPVDPDPINPDDNENVKVLHSYENHGVNLNQVHTPVAYAADLDDDEIDTGVRKNVDGSVTVVRAYPSDAESKWTY